MAITPTDAGWSQIAAIAAKYAIPQPTIKLHPAQIKVFDEMTNPCNETWTVEWKPLDPVELSKPPEPPKPPAPPSAPTVTAQIKKGNKGEFITYYDPMANATVVVPIFYKYYVTDIHLKSVSNIATALDNIWDQVLMNIFNRAAKMFCGTTEGKPAKKVKK